MKYRPKHVVEYALLRTVAASLNALPYGAALSLGRAMARLSYACMRPRAATAHARIREVFGARYDDEQVRRIARLSWRNTVLNAVEMFRMPKLTREWIDARSNADTAMVPVVEHCASGRGGVIACPHCGSWEMAAAACRLHGIPIFTVSGRQRNPLTSRFLHDLRTRPGIPTIVRGRETMKGVIRGLRGGGMLAMLPDVRMKTEGVNVPFLGGRANVGKGMAMFAKQTGVPIWPCLVTRRGIGRHHFQADEPVWPDAALDKQRDTQRMTAAVFAAFEAHIRREPAQWFWFNRRWILDPL